MLRCADVKSKRFRRISMKLRGGTAELRMEIDRWNGLEREEAVNNVHGGYGK